MPLLEVVMNELLLNALQPQPGRVVITLKPYTPPLAGTFALVGLSEYVHGSRIRESDKVYVPVSPG